MIPMQGRNWCSSKILVIYEVVFKMIVFDNSSSLEEYLVLNNDVAP